ncbi:MAG: hypothetical protein OEZ34_16120, partial [Spirochaetia bacterium]|nr:hypothetical protein [Spirochaetia bacterium]
MFLKENDEIRKKSSEEMAVCHYHHLKEELNKSPELLANLTAEGITFEEHTKALIKELEDLFPEISSSKPLEVNESSPNLICDWWENFARTAGRDSYQDSSFKFINAIFMERIKYAKDPSEDAKERLLQSTIDNMIKTRLIERGLPISHLLRIMNDLSRVIERRFAAMGFAPLESYRSLIERLDNVQNSALFQYYFDLAQNALERSDKLLRNILPESIAETLKEEEAPAPIHYDSATVVFTDFVGFSRTAGDMVPVELVHKLDRCFKAYDFILDRYGLEKLKTIGDSYMFAGG